MFFFPGLRRERLGGGGKGKGNWFYEMSWMTASPYERNKKKGREKGKAKIKLKRKHKPLNITTPSPSPSSSSLTTPTYPVSSFNSLTAASAALSPSSTKPAGISMVTLPIGGRNCFCRSRTGSPPSGGCRIARMPTPSMSEVLGRVCGWMDEYINESMSGYGGGLR